MAVYVVTRLVHLSGGGHGHRSVLLRPGIGDRLVLEGACEHCKRLFHGRAGDDNVDRGPKLSFGQPRLTRAHGLGGGLSVRYPRHALYRIGAIPAMLFLGIVMMPFYYISQTHSVPGYLKLRFGESSRALSAISFAFMTVLMSGINKYSMALFMKVVLGWDMHFSIWVSSLTVAVYVALGGLRSAIFNEVLQFILIWAGALLVILGLIYSFRFAPRRRT
jgi:hypothetical protein